MTKIYKSSAPGSIMLMGEHAVLRNELALVGAVDKRITVTLTPHDNNRIEIYSSLGNHHTSLEAINSSSSRDLIAGSSAFKFVLATLKHYHKLISSGFRLDIRSEFSSKVGLGSSAAVVVATLQCLQQWLEIPLNLQQLFLDARDIIQHVQGRGSGADVAASIFGGIVAYRMEPLFIEKCENIFDIALLYTGYKTATPEVIRQVDARVGTAPEKYAELFKTMGQYSEDAWRVIKNKNWSLLGKTMQLHQEAQASLGVCDTTSEQFLNLLNQHPHVLGSKISGSGLGDCLIALITPEFHWKHPNFIDARLSTQGVICETC